MIVNKKLDRFLIACILGDGYITFKKRGKEIYLGIQHGKKQKKYLEYKSKILKKLKLKNHINNINLSKKRQFKAFRLTSYNNKLFLHYRNLFYKNKKKILNRKILNKLDKLGLAIWWQDDGCLSVYTNSNKSTHRYGKLCTHGFSLKENQIIQKYFLEKWKINVRPKLEKRKYWYIYINSTNLKKFFKLIRPYIHKSMNYKINMKFKKKDLKKFNFYSYKN